MCVLHLGLWIWSLHHPLKCVCSERFVRRGVVRKFGGSTHFFWGQNYNNKAYIFRIGPNKAGFSLFTDKTWAFMNKYNFTKKFVCKLGTPSCYNYEHFHVYLAYRRQTGTVVTRQTYDRAPRLTKPPTAYISRGVHVVDEYVYLCFATFAALKLSRTQDNNQTIALCDKMHKERDGTGC